MKSERRKVTRCIVKDNEFHIFNQGSKIAGKLIDISKGGLAYQYKPIKGKKLESNLYDIISAGSQHFYLFDIICKTIYDSSDLTVTHDAFFRHLWSFGLQLDHWCHRLFYKLSRRDKSVENHHL